MPPFKQHNPNYLNLCYIMIPTQFNSPHNSNLSLSLCAIRNIHRRLSLISLNFATNQFDLIFVFSNNRCLQGFVLWFLFFSFFVLLSIFFSVLFYFFRFFSLPNNGCRTFEFFPKHRDTITLPFSATISKKEFQRKCKILFFFFFAIFFSMSVYSFLDFS